MRDFIQELTGVRTAFRGYDREQIKNYITQLLLDCEQEHKKEQEELDTLRLELNGAKSREEFTKRQYDVLLEKFEMLSDAVMEHTGYHERIEEEKRKKGSAGDQLTPVLFPEGKPDSMPGKVVPLKTRGRMDTQSCIRSWKEEKGEDDK